MNDDHAQKVLNEARKIRKIVVWIFIIFMIYFAMSVYSFIHSQLRWRRYSSTPDKTSMSWHVVQQLMDTGEFELALTEANKNIEESPDYFRGYKILGHIYLAMRQPGKAEEAFSKAYELFPSEENHKNLEAVQKINIQQN